MKLAIFGKTGQLARALFRHLHGPDHQAIFFDRQDCDLSHDTKIIENFTRQIPVVDIVIYAAAYTDVEGAETDRATATAVNADAPSAIAAVCAERDIPFIYISTDYVFDGRAGHPYKTSALTSPVNAYGLSKRAGELGIIESGVRHSIIRTSWLYGGNGRNFMTAVLKKAANTKNIQIVGDQIGRPTYVGNLAKKVVNIAQSLYHNHTRFEGVTHICDSGEPVSWAGFAEQIFTRANDEFSEPIEIKEIETSSLSLKAPRPAYSALDISDYEKLVGRALPDWRHGLELALEEWRNSKANSNE